MARKKYAIEVEQGTSKGLFGFPGQEDNYKDIKAKLGVVDVDDTNAKNVYPASPGAVGVCRITIAYTVGGKAKKSTVFCANDKLSPVLGGSLAGETFKGGKIDKAYLEKDVSYN